MKNGDRHKLPARIAFLPVLVAVLIASLVSCSNDAERLVLERFFETSRLRDLTGLQLIATVVFEPMADGIVTRFTITKVGAAERKPLDLRSPDLRVVQRSTAGGPVAVDLSHAVGDVVSEDVTLSAAVKLADGRTVNKTLKVILQRVIVKGDREIVGQWIVTGVIAY
jgi:hypothetical protein